MRNGVRRVPSIPHNGKSPLTLTLTLTQVYFRILKMGKGMAVALLPSTFAGLAKFSHLISIDFLGDLLVALQVSAEYAAPHTPATLSTGERKAVGCIGEVERYEDMLSS